VIADRKSAQIVATAFSHGSKHDFQLFKDDGSDFAEHLRILADAGYQGLAELMKIVKRLSRNRNFML